MHRGLNIFMTRHRKISLTVALISLALLACNMSPSTPTATLQPETPQPTATFTPAYTPTPDLPVGWVTYHSEALAISLYHPAGWELTLYDEPRIDLLESQGQGWIEITVLDQTTMDRWGLDYMPGMDAEDIVGSLASAVAEDGTFEDPQQIENRSALSACVVQGHYDILDDYVLIAAVGMDAQGIILVGHGGSEQGEWERLRPIYEQMVWSVTP
jgi:hypothetical protein